MTDHRLAYRRLRLWIECYALWLCETRFGRGAAADRAFASHDIQEQIASEAERLTVEALGMPQPERPASTLEQDIVFELIETQHRCETSMRPEDRPALPSQVVSEQQARRSKELLALSVRARKMRAA